VFSAEKLYFVSLPEPVSRVNADEILDGIDALDHSDPMLRIAQSKIRGIRNYLHVVEREEIVLLQVFIFFLVVIIWFWEFDIALTKSFHDDIGKTAETVGAVVF
jgi:hypothetical protein